MSIAIFGGSFNPVHMGHFEIVRQIDQQLTLAKIFVIPAYKNPLKGARPSLPDALRLKMLQQTFMDLPNVEISAMELENQTTSYTHHTLEVFKNLYSSHQFYLLLGEDAFASFHLWAKADRILELCNVLIFRRPAIREPTAQFNKFESSTKVQWVDITIPDVSATDIRSSSLNIVKQNNWLHPNALKTWELQS